ncbi:ADP-ribosylglycohydrolase family protein [Enterococcus mundtii]|uniref:ADP-ribosylglycohydrolase family protein n=1 Tax=Enterococcus mundtii TaxID=53346 RepID=UPI002952F035|nr:ADP-ribosylglycohydrolase family protein [Enterococcus mundtii]
MLQGNIPNSVLKKVQTDFVSDFRNYLKFFLGYQIYYRDLFAADFVRLIPASFGYIVDALKAVVWCLLAKGDYREAMLTAVNLGSDMYTVAVNTGSLFGLFMGTCQIMSEKFVGNNNTVELD